MFIVIVLLGSCAAMASRRMRLAVLPAALFFTYNPIRIPAIGQSIGIDAVGMFGCILSILIGRMPRKSPLNRDLVAGLVGFYSVFMVMRYFNLTRGAGLGAFVPTLAGDVKNLILPLLYMWAFAIDIRKISDAHVVLASFALGGAAAALHGIAQFLLVIAPQMHNPPFWATFGVNVIERTARNVEMGRAFGPTPFVSVYGRNMAFLVLLAVWLRLYVPRKLAAFSWVFYGLFGLSLVSLLLTKSLGSGVMVAVGLGVYVAYGKIRIGPAIGIAVAIGAIFSFQIFYSGFIDKISHTVSQTQESSMMARFIIWANFAGETLATAPITGSWQLVSLDSELAEVFVLGGGISMIALWYLVVRFSKFTSKISRFSGQKSGHTIFFCGILSVVLGALSASATGSLFFNPKNGAITYLLVTVLYKLYIFHSQTKTEELQLTTNLELAQRPRMRRLTAPVLTGR